MLRLDGSNVNLHAAARELGCHVRTIYARLESGWSLHRALTESPRKMRKYDERGPCIDGCGRVAICRGRCMPCYSREHRRRLATGEHVPIPRRRRTSE